MTGVIIATRRFSDSAPPIPNPDWAHLRYTRYDAGNVIKFKSIVSTAKHRAAALEVIDCRILSLRDSIETMQLAMGRLIEEAELLQSAEFRRNWPQVYVYEKQLRDLKIAR